MKFPRVFLALLSVTALAAPDPALLKKAQAGDAAAMFALAEAVQLEQPQEAEKWYFKSADLGHPPAELAAFNILEEQSSMEAAQHQRQYRYLLRAAEHGYAPAQFRLAGFLSDAHPMNGEFVDADRKAAAVWYRKAAEQGVPEAMLEWSTDLAAGEYVPKDFAGSLVFQRKAAIAGLTEAQLQLGQLYETGADGFGNKVPVDLRESLRWQRMMAAGGNEVAAQGVITTLLALADPTVAELTEARKLLEKDIAAGNAYAQDKLDDVRRKLGEPVAAKVVAASPLKTPPTAATPPAPIAAAPPVSAPDPRAIALEQLAARYAVFEKEFDAATTAAAREQALGKFGNWIEYDRGGALSNVEAGEWVLHKLTSRLERFSNEAWNLISAVPDRVFPGEMIKRELPSRLLATVQADAKRIVAEYEVENQKKGEIARLLPLANAGDGKAQLALGLAYLSLQGGSKDFWAYALHWLGKAAQARVPGAVTALNKLEKEATARWQTAVDAKDWATVIAIYRQKADSPMPDAAVGAVDAGRLLLSRESGRAQNIPEGIKLLKQAASAGNAKAAYELGLLYVVNEDQPVDEGAALAWFKRAAATGDKDAGRWVELLTPVMDREARGIAAVKIGGERMRREDKVVDFGAAAPWMRFAARLGNLNGRTFVASRYLQTDPQKAFALYREAADAGSAIAASFLAFSYRRGDGVGRDLVLAREYQLKAAAGGDMHEQNLAGLALMLGQGGSIDFPGAREWFLKAATQGQIDAMYHLGELWFERNYQRQGTAAEALEWWKKSSNLGGREAQFQLGLLYHFGRGGLPKDALLARQWITASAKQGHPPAEVAMKQLYGESLTPSAPVAAANVPTTLEQDRAGAAAGNAQSLYLLGERYETGDGVPMDWTIALEWYRKAAAAGHKDARIAVSELEPALNPDKSAGTSAAQPASSSAKTFDQDLAASILGDAEAMFRLGRRYDDGDGVAVNLQEALAWYEKAAARGHEEADDHATDVSIRLQRIKDEKLAGQMGAMKKQIDGKEQPKPAEAGPSADGAMANARMFALRGLDSDAVKMIKRAVAGAETANWANRYVLSGILLHGQYGVPKDPARAMKLLASAAEDRYGPAQVDYGFALLSGANGLVADPVKAQEYFQRALVDAEHRAPEEKKAAAMLLLRERLPGVRSDPTRAFKLIESVADAGDATTQFEYGRELYTGARGLAKDQPRAVTYLRKAEALPEARFVLGQVYERGVDGKPDVKEALLWYTRAGDYPGAAAAAARLREAAKNEK